MRVIKVEPHSKPLIIEIENSLTKLQEEVGGYIQVIYPFTDNVGLVCNDEGKIMGLDYNRALRNDNGYIYDIVCGNFLIVGLSDDDFKSLTDEQIDKYLKYYGKIEEYIVMGNQIITIERNEE